MSQRVFVRCKSCSSAAPAWEIEGRSLYLAKESSCSYSVSKVIPDTTTHEDFFNDTIAEQVSEALEGQSLTILSYGPPSCGKTYSSFGTASAGQFHMKSEARGVATRCIDQLLKKMQEKEMTCRITGSFCHIFPDGRVADLLDISNKNLKVMKGREAMASTT